MDSQLMGFAARAIYELDEEKLGEDEKQIAHSFKEKCTKQVKRRKSKNSRENGMEVHGADFKGNMVTYLRNISFFRML